MYVHMCVRAHACICVDSINIVVHKLDVVSNLIIQPTSLYIHASTIPSFKPLHHIALFDCACEHVKYHNWHYMMDNSSYALLVGHHSSQLVNPPMYVSHY